MKPEQAGRKQNEPIEKEVFHMVKRTKQYPILPYDLRIDIWNLIDQGINTPEIIEKLYAHAPSGVSEGTFELCIRGIRGRHTLGQRPSKNR